MIVLDALLLVLGFTAVSGTDFREAKDEEFPFQVSIKSPNRRHLCGGAIISPTWILTVSDCVDKTPSVTVSYGSADANSFNTIDSSRIVLQNELNLEKRNRLALIQLQKAIDFSKTASQAKLPTVKATLVNTTKLSGWNVDLTVDVPPSLYVTDRYLVIPKDCQSPRTQLIIPLAKDEFCGMDEEFHNSLSSPGTIVSKKAIILGILPRRPLAPSEPYIFVKMSEHNQWIKDVLQSDAQFINWVDVIPKNSGYGLRPVALTIFMVIALCLYL